MAAYMTPESARRTPQRTPHKEYHCHFDALEAVGKRPRQPIPRPTEPLSWELANHCKAYLEANQYASGYSFLHTLLTAATSISVPAKPYIAYLAPATQLALASTLIVYPSITTRAESADEIKGADAALKYLRGVQATIKPDHQILRAAFKFADERTRRRPNRNCEGSQSPGANNDIERLSGAAANTQSLWYRADDFWQVVGWAFNCAVVHRKRWDRWSLWLEVMLDFAEADWQERVRCSRVEGADKEEILMGSLLWQYVSSTDPSNRNNRRRIVKAVLAMADSHSSTDFPEIWPKETHELKPRKDDDKQPLATIDIENNYFGDYEKDQEDTIMHDVQIKATRKSRSKLSSACPPEQTSTLVALTVEEAIQRLGGMDAIQLRQRIIALLEQVACHLPSHFTTFEDLLDGFTEDLVRLPTLIFSAILSTFKMPGLSSLALNANLLLPLVSEQLLNYTTTTPAQDHFESLWLPLRATAQSFATNAKVSLLLEHMFMYMMDQDAFQATDDLRQAVEAGVQARQTVYGSGKGKKGNNEEEKLSREVMRLSSSRLFGLLEVLELAAGKTPQRRETKSKTLPLDTSIGSELSSPPESDTDEDG